MTTVAQLINALKQFPNQNEAVQIAIFANGYVQTAEVVGVERLTGHPSMPLGEICLIPELDENGSTFCALGSFLPK